MTERDATVHRIQQVLLRQRSPRLHMFTLVSMTAAVGLLASFGLLQTGVTAMVVRYPIAVLIAYGAFLSLVALWLRRFRLRAQARNDESIDLTFDVLELPFDAMWKSGNDGAHFGGGGGFSGGGSSGTWDGHSSATAVQSMIAVRPPPNPALSSATAGGDGGGGSWDLDGDAALLIPAAIVAAVAAGALAYVVYIAPSLFAELLLDAGLAAGLYRRLRRIERRDWLTTAIRHTVVPAVFIAVLLGLAGLIMQSVYPDATSIGRVVDHALSKRHEAAVRAP